VWGRGYVLREGAPSMGGHMDEEELLKIA
jgi:hypothetical protein